MLDMSKQLFAEYWNEDEVKLGKDKEQYRNVLSDNERYVYNIVTGMLNQLDSVATDFNFYLNSIVSDPSVRSVISLINSFEVLHNRSYQYLTSTMLNDSEKRQAFEEIKVIPELVKRNEHIFKKIQGFIDSSTDYIVNKKEVTDEFLQAVFEGLIAYQTLEGLHFSGGFVYFHSLARDQKMIQSNGMINLIKTDETQHSEFNGTLIRILMSEFPQLNTVANREFAVNFLKECVRLEAEWGKVIFKDIDLFGSKVYQDYIEYLANIIARNAGFNEPFPNNAELKSRWIVTYGSKKRDKNDANQIVTKTDFLQSNATNYAHESGEDFDL